MNHAFCFRCRLVLGFSCLLLALHDLRAQPAGAQGLEASRAAARRAIEDTLREQARAWNEGNLERFMEPYWKSDELTFSAGGTVTRGWQATLDRYRQRYPDRGAMGRLTFGQLEVRLLGPHAALVLGNWRLQCPAGELEGNFSLVMQRREGRWVIIHDHTSALEAGAGADASTRD